MTDELIAHIEALREVIRDAEPILKKTEHGRAVLERHEDIVRDATSTDPIGEEALYDD